MAKFNYLVPAIIVVERDAAVLLELVDETTGEVLDVYNEQKGYFEQSGWFPKSQVFLCKDERWDIPNWLLDTKRVAIPKTWEKYQS